jgi:hypothetical protein
MKDRTREILKGRVIPHPQHIEILDGGYYKIKDKCTVCITLPESVHHADKLVLDMAKVFWNCAPALTIDYVNDLDIRAEGYQLDVTDDCICVKANDENGLRYAFYSLRQLAEPERGVREFSYYIVPQVKIDDQPSLAFRGVHLCWFPETEIWEIEKQIRLAAYYKMNHVVIESWGVFPFECEPDFCWQEKKVPQSEFKRLVKLAKGIGITLIPQINLLGHASWARGGGGKHAVLSMYPKYQSLYEPDGWSWCLSNPETRTLLTSLVCELHEVFDNPPFFHIGCDEAHSMASCSLCSEVDIGKTITEHICYFHELLAARGARVMMWHDMLLERGDKRWQGYVANGRTNMGVTDIYKQLPKDIVICDWEYDIPDVPEDKIRTWPVSRFFKGEGFEVLVCPWRNMLDIARFGKMAGEENLRGMLVTTWHKNAGPHMYQIYFGSAQIAWNVQYQCYDEAGYDASFSQHVRQVDMDMNITDYVAFGKLNHYQIDPDKVQD